jgi:hypothetical protein
MDDTTDDEGTQESCRQPQLVGVSDQYASQHCGSIAGKRELEKPEYGISDVKK